MELEFNEHYHLTEDVKQYRKGQHIAVTLHFKISTDGNLWFAQGMEPEIAGVIIQERTLERIRREIGKSMKGFHKAFPEQKAILIFRYGRAY